MKRLPVIIKRKMSLEFFKSIPQLICKCAVNCCLNMDEKERSWEKETAGIWNVDMADQKDHTRQDLKETGMSWTEPSIRRVCPTVVSAQCCMTSLVCRDGRHLCPQFTEVDRLFLWQLLTPNYISQPNLLSTLKSLTLTTWTIFRSCSGVYLDMTNSNSESLCHKLWNLTFIQFAEEDMLPPGNTVQTVVT